MISVIVPTFNEAPGIVATLQRLQPLRGRGHEVILVDGGSHDATLNLAHPWVDQVLQSDLGRATQMNAGVTAARGSVLWFVHADTLIDPDMDSDLLQALGTPTTHWGRFDVRLSGDRCLLRLVARLMNLRSRLSGIASGDQGIFVRRAAFERVGGYAEIALMEDIELSRRLKKTQGRPSCLRRTVLTSSRRWERQGIVRTILLMWRLRLAYAFGADPAALVKQYR